MPILKKPRELEIMAEAGRVLGQILSELRAELKPGVSGNYLEKKTRSLITAAGMKPAFLDYKPAGSSRPYPAALCFGVNESVVHGIPGKYAIREGDVVKLDLGLKHKGFCVDAAITAAVGQVCKRVMEFIEATETALEAAIKEAVPGNALGDIGAAIEEMITEKGFNVVRSLTGHGIGRDLHEDPHVLNFGRPGTGMELIPGMILAIEPITAMGTGQIRQAGDDSYVTADGSIAAHFEHTVAITEQGPLVLTRFS